MMSIKNISIKGKLFSIFLLFTIVLLAVLWFFQIVYLDDFYKFIKRNEAEKILVEVQQLLEDKSDVSSELEDIAAKNNLSIFITDDEGNKICSAEYISNAKMSKMPHKTFELFHNIAALNNGSATIEYQGSSMKLQSGRKKARELFSDEEEYLDEYSIEQQDRIPHTDTKGQDEEFVQNFGNAQAESIIYVRLLEIDDENIVVMINSVITPVDATVATLKVQLIIISIIMLLIALLIASIFSKSMSKSIVELNEKAHLLAMGNLDVTFNSSHYKEVAQLSRTLNYAAGELKKTDELQKELIANVSHDLRTPLTMIKGYSEVMRDIPGENTAENVQVIIDETEYLADLVSDMLDISRLKSKTIELNLMKYNLTQSICHVLERYNKLRENEGYLIDFEYDAQVEVYADEKKLFQVIYNLINNAINYTGEDKRVQIRQITKEDTVRIEVSDTGKGVSPDAIPYVWDRYYKDKSKHRRSKQGTGLGLSIVKSVLELHKAKYGVVSKENEGATFWFELKIADVEE